MGIRFFLPFSLPEAFGSGCREASRSVIVLDNDLQLENSFAALSAVQGCQINAGLSPSLSLKLPVTVCSGAELCPRGGAGVGAVLESLALRFPSSCGQDLLTSVFTALPACDSCPVACLSREGGPAPAPSPLLSLLCSFPRKIKDAC